VPQVVQVEIHVIGDPRFADRLLPEPVEVAPARCLVYVADVGSVTFLFVTSSAASGPDRSAAV
jgi:hypothetical protein